MGISPSDLEDITPYEFGLLCEGYQKRQIEEWERVRFLAHKIIQVNVKDPPSIYEILPLPGDQKTEQPKILDITDEEKERIEEIFNRIANKNNGRSDSSS